jgi:hypothetical protein
MGQYVGRRGYDAYLATEYLPENSLETNVLLIAADSRNHCRFIRSLHVVRLFIRGKDAIFGDIALDYCLVLLDPFYR